MQLFLDIFYIVKGKYFRNKGTDYKFVFLVHSRGYKDIYRKYPQLKFIPEWIIVFVINNLWPITISKVTGVNSYHTKKEIQGYVLGIPATAKYLLDNRVSALKKIRQAIYLAKGRGVKIVGLGGLTSSLSGGGVKLININDVSITTGHAYTAFNITQNVEKLAEIIDIPKEYLTIAVVGAAGSVGSTSSIILSKSGFKNIILIDLERKQKILTELKNNILLGNNQINIELSSNIENIKMADIIITATNTPAALVTKKIISPGMIFVDDAQPSDIDIEVLKEKDVLVIEAGVVHTPNISSNFNYGLKNRTDNFCCMAELLILASREWEDHFVINRATLEHVESISSMGKELGFKVANFQNFIESISQDKINHVKSIIRKKYGF